jgi:hypothetical protein
MLSSNKYPDDRSINTKINRLPKKVSSIANTDLRVAGGKDFSQKSFDLYD